MVIFKPTQSEFFSIHTHSKFSSKDALPSVTDIVRRAKVLGYPGLGLTDHGNMAGSVELYTECMKAGIKPFPGSELYIVEDREDRKAKRYHVGVLAFTTEGYRNLIHLSSLTHANFHHKPLIDLADIAQLSQMGKLKGIAVTTGCHFGMVVQKLIHHGPEAAESLIASYAEWFDRCYVEVQNHNIESQVDTDMTDLEVAEQLTAIAKKLDLPVVLAQDSHYCKASDRPVHETLKRLVSFSDDPDDAVFPGDGYHMVDDRWMKDHFPEHIYQAGIAGLKDLLDRHDLRIDELDNYQDRMPVLSSNPQQELRERAEKELKARGLSRKYWERLDSELDIIEFTRSAGYLLLVAAVTDYCNENNIIFQARGSASGSLTCWLLGITSVDPIKYNLLMERFMAKDRIKPPDIDLDVEHTRRREVLEMLDRDFSILQIGTWGKYLMGVDESGEDSGSLMRVWMQMRKKRGQSTEWSEIDKEERKMIDRLSDMETYSGYGVHAAGPLVTSTKADMNYMIPTMYVASSRTTVSQYHMHDVEMTGVVKLDILGLKTLTVISKTLKSIGRDISDGFDWISLTDRKVYQAISRGETDGVFQLEGWTATKGVKEMKPRKIGDIIAAMGLFRPAIMESGATDSYLRRRSGREKVPERHEIIQAITKDTYGILLYQEQVIELLRAIGMSPEELNAFLGAVKASNGNIGNAQGVIRSMLMDVKQRCWDAGMDEVDTDWLEEALDAYSGYGFNLSHSVVYGLTAYRTAYLSVYYPAQFFTALLSVFAGDKKEQSYLRSARKRGIRVLSPDVNISSATYEYDPKRDAIRRGFAGIKGIGDKSSQAIAAGQPYKDFADFVERVDHRSVTGTKAFVKKKDISLKELEQAQPIGVLGKLLEAGAVDSLFQED